MSFYVSESECLGEEADGLYLNEWFMVLFGEDSTLIELVFVTGLYF